MPYFFMVSQTDYIWEAAAAQVDRELHTFRAGYRQPHPNPSERLRPLKLRGGLNHEEECLEEFDGSCFVDR
jgi:hypothetical protein